MSLALGLVGGVGLLLIAAPFLWPRRVVPARRRGPKALTAVKDRLVQAGLERVSVPMFVVVSLVIAAAGAALCFALLPVAALALVAGGAAGVLPALTVSWRARGRRKAKRLAWPDVVDHLVSAVRSGVPLPDAIAQLAESGPADLREPFRIFAGEYAATGNLSVALDDLKLRLADPVADRIVETIRMSREVGGSELPAVLRSLSAYLRQEQALRAEVEARQSWIVNAARLGVAAPWVVLAMLATRPEAALAYNSPAGAVLIVCGLGVTIVAYRLMMALGRLPEERRWLA